MNVTCSLTSDLTLHLPPLHRPSSYHRLRARPFPGEEVPEVGGRWRFALLLRRLFHPDAALGRPGQAGAAAAGAASASAQGEAQRRAQRAPAFLGVLRVLTVEPGEGGGLGQAEQVVVGVELSHVADGFTWRDVTWRRRIWLLKAALDVHFFTCTFFLWQLGGAAATFNISTHSMLNPCDTSKYVPYLTSCLFLLWFSLSTLRNTSLVRLPSPPLPSGGNSGDGGSRGDKLPLEAPTESRDAPVSRRPPDSLTLSTVRWLPLWRRQTPISQRFTQWYLWGLTTDWLSWLPELPSQQVVDDVRVGLDQTHQDLLLQLCRNLEGHKWRVKWAQVFFSFYMDVWSCDRTVKSLL